MPPPHLFSNLEPARKLLWQAKALIQINRRLVPFLYRRRIRLHRDLPPQQHRFKVLRRRWRRKRPPPRCLRRRLGCLRRFWKLRFISSGVRVGFVMRLGGEDSHGGAGGGDFQTDFSRFSFFIVPNSNYGDCILSMRFFLFFFQWKIISFVVWDLCCVVCIIVCVWQKYKELLYIYIHIFTFILWKLITTDRIMKWWSLLRRNSNYLLEFHVCLQQSFNCTLASLSINLLFNTKTNNKKWHYYSTLK